MKHPRIINVLSIITIMIGYIFFIKLTVFGPNLHSNPKSIIPPFAFFAGISLYLWILASSTMLLRPHIRWTYTLLWLNALMLTGMSGYIVHLLKQTTRDEATMGVLVNEAIFVFYIYMGLGIAHLIICTFPHIIRYAKQKGGIQSFAHPMMIVLALIIALLPSASVFLFSLFTETKALCVSNVMTSSGSGFQLVHSTDKKQCWEPPIGNGIGESIKIDLCSDQEVEQVDIITGDPAAFNDYHRVKSVLIELPDGEKFLGELKDSSENQSVKIRHHAKSFVMTIKSVYPGIKGTLRVKSVIPMLKIQKYPWAKKAW